MEPIYIFDTSKNSAQLIIAKFITPIYPGADGMSVLNVVIGINEKPLKKSKSRTKDKK